MAHLRWRSGVRPYSYVPMERDHRNKILLTKPSNFIMDRARLSATKSTNSQADWEKDIVSTEWTDKDVDIAVQYKIDTELLHLSNVDELD